MTRKPLSPYARPGKRNCLKCDKEFDSEDVINNRICRKCNRDNKNVFIPAHGSSTVDTGTEKIPIVQPSDEPTTI